MKKYNKQLGKSLSRHYAEALAFNRKYLTEQGYIYISWDEMELYLNEILKKILPDSLKQNPVIHVYPARMTGTNAFCLGDGSILFNVGFMASAIDEAGIAIVLGHELAHYLNNDMLNVFLRNTKQHSLLHDMLPITGSGFLMKNLEYSRFQEERADSIGFVLASKAGYDVKSALNNFNIFLMESKVANRFISVTNENEEEAEKHSTHPLLNKRIDYLNHFIRSTDTFGSVFLISHQKFGSLKRQAIQECVNLYLSRMDYESAITASFMQYLLNNEDPCWYYYMQKSIEKYVLIFKEKKGSPFMDYLLRTTTDKNILRNLYFLYPDSNFVNKSLADPFSLLQINNDKVTYDMVYNYFLKKSMDAGCKECYLDGALYYNNNKIRKDSLLNTYLTFPNVKKRAFAEVLLKDQLYNNINLTKSALLFRTCEYKEQLISGEYTDYFTSEEKYPLYVESITNLATQYFPDKKVLAGSLSVSFIPSEYFMLANMEHDIQGLIYYNIQNAELFLLNPEYWYFSQKTQVNTFEFLSVYSRMDKTQTIKSGATYLVLPFIWAIRAVGRIFTGPQKHHFEVEYSSVTMAKTLNVCSKQQIVNYKLRIPYFVNTVYHVLKEKDKDSAH